MMAESVRPPAAEHLAIAEEPPQLAEGSPPLEDDALGLVTLQALQALVNTTLAFSTELTEASSTAVEATARAVRSWSRVVWLVLRPLGHAAVMAWPSVKRALFYVAERTAAQPKKALAAEAAALVALVALWRLVAFFRRRRYVARLRAAVGRRYDAFRAGVRRRSRRAAEALPHLLFVAACVAASRLLARLGLRPRALALALHLEPFLSTGLPALRTLVALCRRLPAPDELSHRRAEQRLLLEYWVVWASVQLVVGLLCSVPLVPRLARMALPLLERTWWPPSALHELPFCGYLWLQLPGTRGERNTDLVYRALAPELAERAARAGAVLPAVPDRAKAAAQLVLATAIGGERSAALADALSELYVLLAGLVFLLTPTPIASVGLLLLALAAPILRAVDALRAAPEPPPPHHHHDERAIAERPSGGAHGRARGKGNDEFGSALTRRARRGGAAAAPAPAAAVVAASAADAGAEAEADAAVSGQLRYWLWHAMLLGCLRAFAPLLAWLPFVTHAKLIAVLWLQLPVVRGAARMLSVLLPVARAGLRLRGSSAAAAATPTVEARAPRANALYSSRLSEPRLNLAAAAASGTGETGESDQKDKAE